MSEQASQIKFENLHACYLAMVVLGNLARCSNGRRRQRLEMEARAQLHTPDPTNNARRARLAPRGERRIKIRELRTQYAVRIKDDGGTPPTKKELRAKFPFRPVDAYLGPKPKDAWADVRAYLYTKDHDKAQEWAEKQAARRLPIVKKSETAEVVVPEGVVVTKGDFVAGMEPVNQESAQ